MNQLKLSFSGKLRKASIQLDGSKSISNRLLILQQVVNQPFNINNLSTSDDTRLMQDFFLAYSNNKALKEFNVQNAGTVSRFLTAFLANQHGTEITLTCAEPMKKRPIHILVNALRTLGAEIIYLEKEGFLPLHIKGKALQSNDISISASVSSQYISALMMLAPQLPNGLTIHLEGEIASKPYLGITQKVMQQLGIVVNQERANTQQNVLTLKIERLTNHQEDKVKEEGTVQTLFCESDWSAAAFYYTICAFVPNSEITLTTLFHESSQGDAQVAILFKELGVQSTFENHSVTLKNVQKVHPLAEKTQLVSFDFIDTPDMVPAIAITCAGLGIEATFTGVKNLVIKESNRLKALQSELQKVGVSFKKINNNEWHLIGKANFNASPIVFDTYEDHRMAMSLACFAFLGHDIVINEPQVVSKSYTTFWRDIKLIMNH